MKWPQFRAGEWRYATNPRPGAVAMIAQHDSQGDHVSPVCLLGSVRESLDDALTVDGTFEEVVAKLEGVDEIVPDAPKVTDEMAQAGLRAFNHFAMADIDAMRAAIEAALAVKGEG